MPTSAIVAPINSQVFWKDESVPNPMGVMSQPAAPTDGFIATGVREEQYCRPMWSFRQIVSYVGIGEFDACLTGIGCVWYHSQTRKEMLHFMDGYIQSNVTSLNKNSQKRVLYSIDGMP